MLNINSDTTHGKKGTPIERITYDSYGTTEQNPEILLVPKVKQSTKKKINRFCCSNFKFKFSFLSIFSTTLYSNRQQIDKFAPTTPHFQKNKKQNSRTPFEYNKLAKP